MHQLKRLLWLILLSIPILANAQSNQKAQLVPKPLYPDPVYDRAADPVVVWNKAEKKWFMLYTNRRANVKDLDGVTWVHGIRIGL